MDGEERAKGTKNDFSKGSIPKAILRLAIPLTAAQIVNILYNLVDRMYIGRMEHVGRLALTGVGITMPIIAIIIGFSNLCGTGGAPLSSMERGKGDIDRAENIMGNAFMMLLIIGVVLTAVCYVVKRPLLYFFGASDDTFQYANEYLSVYLIGTVLVMIGLGMNPFINSQGFGRTGMMTVVLGAAINIALDPLFIFVFQMGVRGAALATIISQGCSAVWVLKFLTGKKAIMQLRFKYMRLQIKIVGKILSLGISGFVLAATNSLVMIVCNKTVYNFGGDLYVSVMTVISSVRELTFSAVNGLTSGATPVISYNYGAKKYGRICKAIRFTSFAAFLCSFAVWVPIMLFPEVFIKIFNNDPELVAAGAPAFRIFFAMALLMWLQLTGQTVALSLGKAKTAIFFSLLRKAILVTPLAIILPHVCGLGVNGVFLSEPISNIIGGVACYTTMLITVYRPMSRLAKTEPSHE